MVNLKLSVFRLFMFSVLAELQTLTLDRPDQKRAEADNLRENKVITQFGKVISLIINIIFQFSVDQPKTTNI